VSTSPPTGLKKARLNLSNLISKSNKVSLLTISKFPFALKDSKLSFSKLE